MRARVRIVAWGGAALVLASSDVAVAEQFVQPQKVTENSPGDFEYRLTRNSSHSMAYDEATGTIAVTYWKGAEAFSSADPGRVYINSSTGFGDWDSEVEVTDIIAGPSHPGARHSSILRTADGDVHVFWHDARNGSAGLGFANNLEIYHDVYSAGAPGTDERLTTTSAVHAGDNGYVAMPAIDSQGRIVIAWYDFNANASIADIYIKESNTSGIFVDEAIASLRRTNYADRGNVGSFVLPALAITPDDERHVVWMREDNGDIYYGHVAPAGTSLPVNMIAAGVGDFFDPPRIAASPNGDVWIANADENGGNEDIILRRLRSGETTFDLPINITNHAARQHSPSLQVLSDNSLCIAWIDERGGQDVYFARFDPSTSSITSQSVVTDGWQSLFTGSLARPDILVVGDDEETVLVLWEEELNSSPGGEIWFSRTAGTAAARHWMNYE